MFIIYNLVQLFCFSIGLPYWIYLLVRKQKYRNKLKERLGIGYPEKVKVQFKDKTERILIHGVSVGEVNAAFPLIEHLHKERKYLPVLSTTTHTGYKSATEKNPPHPVLYFPLDFLFSVKRFLNLVRPKMIIMLETEIWPNFYLESQKRHIPLILINARLSDKSFNGYHLFLPFFKRILKSVSHIAVQTPEDRSKFLQLHFPEQKISIIGNLKFNSAIQKKSKSHEVEFLSTLQGFTEYPVFVAGSTQPEEEKVILGLFRSILKRIPHLKLILAPRHIERIPDIENVLKGLSLPYSFFSRVKIGARAESVILVDTIGDLFYLYSFADVVFIGKSLFPPGGGQNMIEPAVWEKPVLFGPYVKNFHHFADLMLREEAAIMVRNAEELQTEVQNLLLSEEKRSFYSKKASLFIEKNTNALKKSIEIIEGISKNIFF